MTQFARLEQLLGRENTAKLQSARVGVFGMGAVGSYAVEALARAGVGYLRLVDFDRVQQSNLNRQLFALNSTVGEFKVDLARQRVLDINPECRVDARRTFIDEKSVAELLESPLDVVIDAIDSVSSKVWLLKGAVDRELFTICSMGAAGRLDAGEVTVGDLAETHSCPLARIIRKRLHRHGIYTGIHCVYSPEPALNKQPAPAEDYEAPTRGRQRTPIGSISYVTGTFGLRAAGEAIRYVLETEVPVKGDIGSAVTAPVQIAM